MECPSTLNYFGPYDGNYLVTEHKLHNCDYHLPQKCKGVDENSPSMDAIIAFHNLSEDTVQVHDSNHSFTDLERGSIVIRDGVGISRPDEIWGSGKCGQKARKPPFKQIQLRRCNTKVDGRPCKAELRYYVDNECT